MTRMLGSRWAYAAVVADMDGVLVDAAAAYPDVVAVLDRWRRGELEIAVVSASSDCPMILEFAGIEDRVDVIVADAQLDRRAALREAARRLGLDPSRIVALASDDAGIRAACETGFGLVVAVARDNHADALAQAGADRVVRELGRLRFLRVLPSALDHRAELRRRQAGRTLALVLDYEGTLTPMADERPRDAMRSCLAAAAERGPVVVVSGRDRVELERRVGVPGLVYAGCHGLDVAGGGLEACVPAAEAALASLAHAEQRFARALADVPGALVERRRFELAVHYRTVESEVELEAIRAIVDEVQRETGLRRRDGDRVFELDPVIAWSKGGALAWILDVLGGDPLPVYVGDDESDEDGFLALAGEGIGIRVGPPLSCSLADYRLADPDELRELLGWWVADDS